MSKRQRTAVICSACQVTVLAEDVPEHENSEEHEAKAKPWRLQQLVNRTMKWRCPGRPFGGMLPSGR